MIGVNSAEHDPARAAIGQARPEPTNHVMACDVTSFFVVSGTVHTLKNVRQSQGLCVQCQAQPGFVCSMSGKARLCVFNSMSGKARVCVFNDALPTELLDTSVAL
jgi:hypothetical protein